MLVAAAVAMIIFSRRRSRRKQLSFRVKTNGYFTGHGPSSLGHEGGAKHYGTSPVNANVLGYREESIHQPQPQTKTSNPLWNYSV